MTQAYKEVLENLLKENSYFARLLAQYDRLTLLSTPVVPSEVILEALANKYGIVIATNINRGGTFYDMLLPRNGFPPAVKLWEADFPFHGAYGALLAEQIDQNQGHTRAHVERYDGLANQRVAALCRSPIAPYIFSIIERHTPEDFYESSNCDLLDIINGETTELRNEFLRKIGVSEADINLLDALKDHKDVTTFPTISSALSRATIVKKGLNTHDYSITLNDGEQCLAVLKIIHEAFSDEVEISAHKADKTPLRVALFGREIFISLKPGVLAGYIEEIIRTREMQL